MPFDISTIYYIFNVFSIEKFIFVFNAIISKLQNSKVQVYVFLRSKETVIVVPFLNQFNFTQSQKSYCFLFKIFDYNLFIIREKCGKFIWTFSRFYRDIFIKLVGRRIYRKRTTSFESVELTAYMSSSETSISTLNPPANKNRANSCQIT